MKTPDELKEFYANELSADLRQLEKKRKRLLPKMVFIVIVSIALIMIGFKRFLFNDDSPDPLLFFIVGSIIFCVISFRLIRKSYRTKFKRQIIGKIVRFLNPALSYHADGYLDERTFTEAKLFTHSIDRYKSEDLVRGCIDKTDIVFSELHAEYKSGSGEYVKWRTIFKGLFFIADFNKHFHGQTLVLPDSTKNLFESLGEMLKSWFIEPPDLIKLEDPVFEREFIVYGSNQIEARYILSTSLMRRILDFKHKTGTNIYLSFTDSKVHVAIPMNRDMFEPQYTSSIIDFEPILEYYQDLSLAIGIVDDLNLNTRIWTKE